MPDTIEHNFTRSAATYDKYNAIQQRVGAGLLATLDPIHPQRILEIGCGTGTFTAQLHTRFPDTEIHALDLSQAMIDRANARLAGSGIHFHISDVMQLPDLGPFDLVIANACLHWLPNMHQGLKRLVTYLNPEGILSFSAFGPGTYKELGTILAQVKPAGPVPASVLFSDESKIHTWTREVADTVRMNTRWDTQVYDSMLSLLRKIKYSGTQGTHGRGHSFTRRDLRILESTYRQRYGCIRASYEVIYAYAKSRRTPCNPSS